jgi:hypothetical protein
MPEHKSQRRPHSKHSARKGGRRKQNDAERYPTQWIIARDGHFPRLGDFDNQVYSVVDGFHNLAVLTTSALSNSFVSITFTLASLSDYTAYTGVFDQYRIRGAEVTFKPSYSGGLALGSYTGSVYSVIDYDDNNSITPSQALDYPNVIISNIGDTVVRSFTPHAANAFYAGGVFTSFGNVAHPWVDSGSPNVVHFSLKIAVDPTTTAVTYDSNVRLWMEFRNPR